MNIDNQAELISGFLGISLKNAKDRLSLGFHANHHEVAKDFIDNSTNVDDPNSLLNWYRTTDCIHDFETRKRILFQPKQRFCLDRPSGHQGLVS